jgi:hypothetical protein
MPDAAHTFNKVSWHDEKDIIGGKSILDLCKNIHKIYGIPNNQTCYSISILRVFVPTEHSPLPDRIVVLGETSEHNTSNQIKLL